MEVITWANGEVGVIYWVNSGRMVVGHYNKGRLPTEEARGHYNAIKQGASHEAGVIT